MTNKYAGVPVTEKDFRMPEFLDARPEDYEFRDDGAIVRKDRWERAMREIAGIMEVGRGAIGGFEIPAVVEAVRELKGRMDGLLK